MLAGRSPGVQLVADVLGRTSSKGDTLRELDLEVGLAARLAVKGRVLRKASKRVSSLNAYCTPPCTTLQNKMKLASAETCTGRYTSGKSPGFACSV